MMFFQAIAYIRFDRGSGLRPKTGNELTSRAVGKVLNGRCDEARVLKRESKLVMSLCHCCLKKTTENQGYRVHGNDILDEIIVMN